MKNRDDHWMPISDIMSGLMIVFMFIAIVFMMQLENEIYNYADIKHKIYLSLYE